MAGRESARDAAIAAVGRPRRRGGVKRFDNAVRIVVDDDLHRRVEAFAETEQISRNEAWRTLATLALNELEQVGNR
jgi:hypothetical protein